MVIGNITVSAVFLKANSFLSLLEVECAHLLQLRSVISITSFLHLCPILTHYVFPTMRVLHFPVSGGGRNIFICNEDI